MTDDWIDRAACKGANTDLFFIRQFYDVARKVCAECPVQRECLDWAIDNITPEPGWSVWGGLSADMINDIRVRPRVRT